MNVTNLEEEELQIRAERARDRLSASLSALRVRRRRLTKKLRPARYLVPALAVGTAAVVLGLMMRGGRNGGPSLLGELARRALLAAAGVVATRLAVRLMSPPVSLVSVAAGDED